MFARRSDLPLDKDALSRFLPWLIAFMVFLAVMAMAGVLVLNTVAARWDRGVSGTLTVQIIPAENAVDDDARLQVLKIARELAEELDEWPPIDEDLRGVEFLEESMTYPQPEVMRQRLGMSPRAFRILTKQLGLRGEKGISAWEKLSIFLQICRTGASAKQSEKLLQRNKEAISKYFNEVLECIMQERFYS